MSVAVYPGSFDPITNGHVDVLEQALNVFERVVVGVLANPRKSPLLPVDERIRIIQASLAGTRPPPSGRGRRLRRPDRRRSVGRMARRPSSGACGPSATSSPEMQLAHNNRVLAPEVDTVFFMTAVANGYVSSSLVKEIASFGGDVSGDAARTGRRRPRAALDRR